MKWNKLSSPKEDDGMGFQEFEAFNLALLAKLGWHFIKNPSSLAARTIGAKYFNRKNILKAKIGHVPSYTW